MSSKYSVSIILKAIDAFTAPIRHLNNQLKSISKAASFASIQASANRFGQSLRSVAGEANNLAIRMGTVAVAAGGAFMALIKPASEMENLRFRLERLYGSMAKGREMFKIITDFAATSPYGIQSITDSLLKFKGQGFDNLGQFKNIMNYLAVYVPDEFRATNAVVQMTQAWGKAKLQMADIRPMIEAGIPVWELLSKVTGKNVSALMVMSEKGLLTRDIMSKMFTLMGKKAQGAGEGIFDLWSTKISNLGDTWTIFADNLMQTKVGDLPLFGVLKKDIQALTDTFKTGLSDKQIKAIAVAISEVYATIKDILVNVIFPLAKYGMAAFKGISQAVGGASNALKLMLAIMAAPLMGSILTATAAFAGLILEIGGLVAAQGLLVTIGAAIAAINWPIVLVTAGIAAIAAGAVLVYQNWNSISAWLVSFWQKYGGLITLVFPPLGLLIDAAGKLIANWEPVAAFFQSLWSGVVSGVQGAVGAVGQFASLAKGVVDWSAGMANGVLGRPNPTPNTAKPPKRALGGPVTGGSPYLVGERGPELFMPNNSGSIIPNNMLSSRSGGGQDAVYIHLKIDSEGRPKVEAFDQKGPRKMDLNLDMGWMTA